MNHQTRNNGQKHQNFNSKSNSNFNSKSNSTSNFNAYYLNNGYFTDSSKKSIRREIIVEEAEKIANALFYKKMTPTTLRRFFNKLRSAYDQYLADKDNFIGIVNKIQELEPDAANAVKRKVAPHIFRDFIRLNAQLAAEDPENLRAFVRHYQSVICYFPEKN